MLHLNSNKFLNLTPDYLNIVVALTVLQGRHVPDLSTETHTEREREHLSGDGVSVM